MDQPQEELPQLISIAWLMPYTFLFHSFPLLITLGLLFGDLFALLLLLMRISRSWFLKIKICHFENHENNILLMMCLLCTTSRSRR